MERGKVQLALELASVLSVQASEPLRVPCVPRLHDGDRWTEEARRVVGIRVFSEVR